MTRVLVVGLLVTLSFMAGMLVTERWTESAAQAGGVEPAPLSPASAAGTQPPAGVVSGAPTPQLTNLPGFSEVATRAVHAVTNISSLQVIRTRRSPFASDPFFRYFFGDDEDLFGGRSRREASLGSGVIVSSDGYVLTNQHVVGDNVREISVALSDKRELRGTLVGVDRWTDLALIKIEATGLPAMRWGDSSALKIAEWVLAIGNPFQLNQTVTLGIISAVGRANVGIATYEDFIQTDAAINPGNSGGALINALGELVGINTAIYSQSGGYQGVGFAVPSNLARRVMNDLIEYGHVRRGSIGYLELADLTTQLADQLGVESGAGALVSRMRRDTAAYDAGIRPGDVIVTVHGQAVEDASHALRLLSDAEIGSTATVVLSREGRAIEAEVEITLARPRR